MRKYSNLLAVALALTISYIFMCAFYLSISVGLPAKTVFLQLRRYIPNAIVIALMVLLWHKSGRPTFKLLTHIFVALCWAIVYPLTYWLTFHLNTNFIDNHFDISFAAYIFVFTASSQLLLAIAAKTSTTKKATTLIISFCQMALLIIPIIQILYFATYRSPVTEAACIALLQTNRSEAYEFFMQNIGYAGLGAIMLLLIVVFTLLAINNHDKEYKLPILSPKATYCVIILLLSSGIYGGTIFKETGAVAVLNNAQHYFDNAQKFNTYHNENINNLVVNPSQPKISKPGTIIIIIGESATSDYMSVYHQTVHDTTPWMRTMSENPNFIVFRHAYTSWAQTVPALERALTEKNQYNNIDFNQSITVLDIAKKAGYTTYWFSNQGTISDADTPITLVAKTADYSFWIESELANSNRMRYDEDLIPYLRKVDPTKNNLIVLHIMGSHDSYANRYPKSFTKWPAQGDSTALNEYDNSLAYTDWFLQKVYDYGKSNLNLQAMLYFADHGVDPKTKRNPNEATFVALRIPMFLYLSDEYTKTYPQTSRTLQQHEYAYFTNDLIYDMVCGLFNITSNHYDASNSLASDSYKYSQENLTTLLGKKNLTEDAQ